MNASLQQIFQRFEWFRQRSRNDDEVQVLRKTDDDQDRVFAPETVDRVREKQKSFDIRTIFCILCLWNQKSPCWKVHVFKELCRHL